MNCPLPCLPLAHHLPMALNSSQFPEDIALSGPWAFAQPLPSAHYTSFHPAPFRFGHHFVHYPHQKVQSELVMDSASWGAHTCELQNHAVTQDLCFATISLTLACPEDLLETRPELSPSLCLQCLAESLAGHIQKMSAGCMHNGWRNGSKQPSSSVPC